MWVHRTIIVDAAQVELARSLCATLAGPAGDGMFTTPLSASGNLPATHYISAGLLEDEFANLLPNHLDGEQLDPGNPTTIVHLVQQLGVEVTEAVVSNLLAAVYVSEAPSEAVLSFLNLTTVQEV